MSKEEQEALELVKDFLKNNGYKGTLECLEKEDSYKAVTEKKSKVKPNYLIKSNQTLFLFLCYQKYLIMNTIMLGRNSPRLRAKVKADRFGAG